MKLLSFFIGIFFFLLAFVPQTHAQEPTAIESCFDYYNYGKMSVSISADTTTYKPGDAVKLSGTIKNNNSFPILDVVLYAQIKRVNSLANFTDNGHFYIDQKVLKENLSFTPGETKWIETTLPIPTTYPNGSYQIQYFLYSKHLFHYAGRPFLQEDFAGATSFTIANGQDPLVYFDISSLRVNGGPHNLRETITEFRQTPLEMTVGILDQRTQKEDIPVSIKWYYFENTSESLLVKTEKQSVKANENGRGTISVSFTPPSPGAYMLVVETDSPMHSILSYRFALFGSESKELRMNDLGVSNYPGDKAGKAWVCFHSPSWAKTPETNVLLELLNSQKQVVEKKMVSQSFGPDVGAITIPLTNLSTPNDFWVRSTFTQVNNPSQLRTVETHYDCNIFNTSLSTLDTTYDPNDGSEIKIRADNHCNQEITNGGFIDSIRIKQGEQIKQEAYNLTSIPKSYALNSNLPPGKYTVEIQSGSMTKTLDLDVPPLSARQKKISPFAIIVFLTIIIGGVILWLRKKQKKWPFKSLNHRLPILLIFTFLCFLYPGSVEAAQSGGGLYSFGTVRLDISGYARYVFPTTLNPQIMVNPSGKLGTGCAFNLDVFAKGEWVTAGGYFDSPPYSWGSDQFFPITVSANGTTIHNMSFTCKNPPEYTVLDKSSFLTITPDTAVPPNTQGDLATGKRFSVQVANTTEPNTSFTVKLGYTTTCQLKDEKLGVIPYWPDGIPISARTGSPWISDLGSEQFVPQSAEFNYTGTISSDACSVITPPVCNAACLPDGSANQCPQPTPGGIDCSACRPAPTTPVTPGQPTPTPNYTCQPPRACGQPCTPHPDSTINDCANVPTPPTGGNCSACLPNPNNPSENICQPPPQCGSPCIPGDNKCPTQGCPLCLPGSDGKTVCTAPSPTPIPPTATPKPPACNEECNPYNNQCPQGTPDKNACPACIPASDGKYRCQPPPPTITPRPTPNCACDSIDYQIDNNPVNQGLFAKGQNVKFTAYAKFVDSPQAELKQMTFHLQKQNPQGQWVDYQPSGVGSTTPTATSAPGRTYIQTVPPPPIMGPTTVQQSNPLIERYAATWTLTMPSLDDGRYRVIVPKTAQDFVCGYKSGGSQLTTNSLQPTTNNLQPISFFGRILAFFERLMGVNQNNSNPNTQAFISPNQVTVVAPSGQDAQGLQLGTFDLTHPPSPTPQIYRHCTDVEWVIPKK